jgi:GAF domain-containing protein
VALNNPIQESLAALSNYLVGDSTMGHTLVRVCEATLGAVEAARYAGIAMAVDANVGTWVATHRVVEEIDASQYRSGEGPSLEALSTGQVVLVRSTFEDGPYREFRAEARRRGILSALALPMRTGSETIAALNLYAEAEHAFRSADIDDASAFASQAAFVLANARAYWEARALSENLTRAMESRAVIEQAKGIIIGVSGVSPDEAFEQLKRQSQYENVKVREIAAEIVNRAQRGRSTAGDDSTDPTT